MEYYSEAMIDSQAATSKVSGTTKYRIHSLIAASIRLARNLKARYAFGWT
jgi:hypothetical protein